MIVPGKRNKQNRNWFYLNISFESSRDKIRDFPQTKFDNGKNSPFLLNEHGDPRFFLQVFAKNSVMKNIFEAEKK